MSVYRDALKKVDEFPTGQVIGSVAGFSPTDDGDDRSIDREFIGLIDHVIQNQFKLVCFTTSRSGDGATHVSQNFARNLAKHFGVFESELSQPHLVLLVDFTANDADMAESTAGRTLNAYFQTPEISLSNFVIKGLIEGVDYLPVGKGSNGPLDIVASIARHRVENHMFNSWEYIVFDCPPVHSNYETYVLCRQLDAVYLVVNHASTKTELAVRAADILRGSGNFAGVVLNRKKHRIPDWIYRRLQAR